MVFYLKKAETKQPLKGELKMSDCEWNEIDQAMFDQDLELFFDIAFDHAKKGMKNV